MKLTDRPHPKDAPHWYKDFWALVPGNNLITALEDNWLAVKRLLDNLSPKQLEFRYAPDKWTLKQVLIHLIDEERYYAYKAFCCSRGTPVLLEIPMGADYRADFNAAQRNLTDIRDEATAVRSASITLFQTMTPAMLDLRDESQADIYTARSIGWFIAGHSYHHLQIIHDKYLAAL